MCPDRRVQNQPQPLTLVSAACAVVALAAAPMRPVLAQASVSASIASEYSARGVSLSEGRPSPQLRVDLDSKSGWYGGALAARVALPDSAANVQLIAYGGYAQRLFAGTSWEAGALDVSFPRGEQYRYREVYFGLAGDRTEGRIYFSPAYYGGGKTVYAELNASYPLRDGVSLTGHAGLLHPSGDAGDDARDRLDLRLGLAVDAGRCNLQVALIAGAPGRHRREAARALAVSASYSY